MTPTEPRPLTSPIMQFHMRRDTLLSLKTLGSLKKAPGAATIALISLLLFVVTSGWQGGQIGAASKELWGFSAEHFWSGQLWLPLSASFLHENSLQLVVNLVFLLGIATRLERTEGSFIFAKVFLIGALLSNPLASILFSIPAAHFGLDAQAAQSIDVGASLGIFACIGALYYESQYSRRMIFSLAAVCAEEVLITRDVSQMHHLVALTLGWAVSRKMSHGATRGA